MAVWGFIVTVAGVLVGAVGLVLGESRARRAGAREARADERAVNADARADRAEERATRAEAREVEQQKRAERAEAREVEQTERERRRDTPQLRLKHFGDEGRANDQPNFLAIILNAGSQAAMDSRLEIWRRDDPATVIASDAQPIPAHTEARFNRAVPQDWTINGGRKLADGVCARVVDSESGAFCDIPT